MQESQASRTALRVAIRRAAHQLFDDSKVLDDPIALTILGPAAVEEINAKPHKYRGKLAGYIRAFMAVRSRYAEDELARAVERGVRQYVILGAGLDTFAYRNPYAESVRVFEADHPATQEWKRRQLSRAKIAIPPSVTFAAIHFERQPLLDGLAAAGFDPRKTAFFSWLGVTMYLTEEAVEETFRGIASTPPGGGVTFDYAVPRESLGWIERMALDALMRRVEAAGEPFQSFFDPSVLARKLTALGFDSIEDLDAAAINARYFQNRPDGLRVGGGLGRLMSARVKPHDRRS